MKNCAWLLVFVAWMAIGCKDKKKSLSGEEEMTISDFITSFDERALPFNLEDTSLNKKEPDSLKIGYSLFTGFVPDTIFRKEFGKGVKPTLFPLGRISVKDKETYVMIKAVTAKRRAAYILAFNEIDSFVTAMPLLTGERVANTGFSAAIDKRYTITKTKLRRQSSGEMLYTKDAYVFNSAGVFTLILTESNDVSKVQEMVINPIDTFPAKHKWAGDYIQNKKNFVSVRDGRNDKEVDFFIHFEKSGDCNGELKGTAKFIAPNIAQFSEPGDPCVLQLKFSGSSVTLKEEKGCGAYRGIKCFFEGSYTRKKKKK